MVAQFPVQTTTPPKNLLPQIKVDIKTFTESTLSLIVPGENSKKYRMCAIDFVIKNIKKSLAVATFSRIFTYAQSLANSGINPIENVNVNIVDSSANLFQSRPTALIELSIDAVELIPVCSLMLSINNLRLDYMDEYFASTLMYLTSAITNDLNPDS